MDTPLCDKVCQSLATDWWFSPGTSDSFTNKTDRQDKLVTEILLKVALKTLTLTLIYRLFSYLYTMPCFENVNFIRQGNREMVSTHIEDLAFTYTVQCTYIVGKYKIYLYELYKKVEKRFGYVFIQYTYIVGKYKIYLYEL